MPKKTAHLLTNTLALLIYMLISGCATQPEPTATATQPPPTATATEEPALPIPNAVGSDLETELPEGDPINGEALIAAMGCVGCHSLEQDTVILGPSFYGVADRAATRIEGYDAHHYLHESIVQPNAYLVEGFPGVMVADFGDRIDAQQLADIIAFLLTQTE